MAIRKRSSVVKSWAIWAIYDMTDMQKSTRNCSTDLCTRLVVTVNWVISPQNTYSLGWLYRGWRHIGHVRLEKKKQNREEMAFRYNFSLILITNMVQEGCTGFVQIFGSKIQDFFQTFSKTMLYFSRLKVNK